MSPERRTQFGIFWKDETLGVTEEGVYAQNAHFDIKPVRVRTGGGRPDGWWGMGRLLPQHQGVTLWETRIDSYYWTDAKPLHHIMLIP
jgi:hypothetical protein